MKHWERGNWEKGKEEDTNIKNTRGCTVSKHYYIMSASCHGHTLIPSYSLPVSVKQKCFSAQCLIVCNDDSTTTGYPGRLVWRRPPLPPPSLWNWKSCWTSALAPDTTNYSHRHFTEITTSESECEICACQTAGLQGHCQQTDCVFLYGYTRYSNNPDVLCYECVNMWKMCRITTRCLLSAV